MNETSVTSLFSKVYSEIKTLQMVISEQDKQISKLQGIVLALQEKSEDERTRKCELSD